MFFIFLELFIFLAVIVIGYVFIKYFILLFLALDLMVVYMLPDAINGWLDKKILPTNIFFNSLFVLIYIGLTLYLLNRTKSKKLYMLIVTGVTCVIYIGGIRDKAFPLWVMIIMYAAFLFIRYALISGLLLGRLDTESENVETGDNGFEYQSNDEYSSHNNTNNNIQNGISEFKDNFESACDMLNLSYNCSFTDVKDNYRVFAKQYHPDINKDDSSTRKLQKINEAYNFLTEDNIETYQKLK